MNKQLKLSKGIQIWVRSLTIRGIGRGWRISYKQVIIQIWICGENGVFGGMRRREWRIYGRRKKRRRERTKFCKVQKMRSVVRWNQIDYQKWKEVKTKNPDRILA